MSNDERKVWATVLLLNAIMHWKVIHVNFFCFFCHVSTTTVFFLLPWQRDETTSPLYILESKFKKVSLENQTAEGRDGHVPFFFAPIFITLFVCCWSIYNVRVSVFTLRKKVPHTFFVKRDWSMFFS